jgi:hypothetical protein
VRANTTFFIFIPLAKLRSFRKLIPENNSSNNPYLFIINLGYAAFKTHFIIIMLEIM